jgi:hypothetical protein
VGHIGHRLLQHVWSPSMPPGQKPRDEKVIQTIQAIKDCGWRSTNQFVEVFYGSTVAAQSLRYQPGSEYSPERIMSAWMKNVPSGDARQVLNLAITRKAAEIMVKESTRAYHNDFLRLSASELTADFVGTDFGLEKIKKIYSTFLPCLTLLLSTLLMAQNDYEKKKGVEKIGKEVMAAKACFPSPPPIPC